VVGVGQGNSLDNKNFWYHFVCLFKGIKSGALSETSNPLFDVGFRGEN
jgi:hypothetical protein